MPPPFSDKGGGFGSLPKELFENIVGHYEMDPTKLPKLVAEKQVAMLAELARTEHSIANAAKEPYYLDVVLAVINIEGNFKIVKNKLGTPVDVGNAAGDLIANLKALGSYFA
jgi:hypothetical protein